MGARERRARAAHDPRSGVLLRRHGPQQERPEHADDELRVPRHRRHPVGAVRVQPVVRQRHRRGPARQPAVRRVVQHRRPVGRLRSHRRLVAVAGPGRDSRPRVLHVPADVRGHHPGADLGRDRGPARSSGPGACSSSCGRPSSTSRWRTGCSRSTGSSRPTRSAAGSPTRTSWARWTSPAARPCTSTPVPPASRWPSSSASAAAGRASPMRPHNLPFVLLGAEPAVVRLVRLQRRLGAGRRRPGRPSRSSNTDDRHRRRRCSAGSSWSRSATGSPPASAPRPAPSPAWSRSPRLPATSAPLGAIADRPHRRRALCARRRPQVPLRLRRLARRRRRPPRRRPRRHPADRVLRHHERELAQRRRPVLRRRVHPARQAGGGRVHGAALLVRGHLHPGPRSSRRRSASGCPTEAEAESIDEHEHAESAYDFSTLRSIGGSGTPRPDAATPAAAAHVPAHASKES